MPKHCVFADSLLIVSHVQGALRKELLMAFIVKCFKTVAFAPFGEFLLIEG